jgi:hypothetical protein
MMQLRCLLHRLLQIVAVLMGNTFLELCISMGIAVLKPMTEGLPNYGIWQQSRVTLLLRIGFPCCAQHPSRFLLFSFLQHHSLNRYSEGWGVRQDLHMVYFECCNVIHVALLIHKNRRNLGILLLCLLDFLLHISSLTRLARARVRHLPRHDPQSKFEN